MLFKYQQEIKDIDKSILKLSNKVQSRTPGPDLTKCPVINVITFDHPEQFRDPEELNPT